MNRKRTSVKLHTKKGSEESFFAEHDRRRGTSFLKTFPEMEEFWQECKSI